LHAAKFLTDWHTALPTQAALARFMDDGAFARHVRRMRDVYRERHATMVGGLERLFNGDLEVVASSVGLHVCAVSMNRTVNEIAAIVARASAVGVELHPLALFAATAGRQRAGLVLGYGAIVTDAIDEGLRRLRACFER
jgi:GntR family transcriptional regulator/MocR family aminotransferase